MCLLSQTLTAWKPLIWYHITILWKKIEKEKWGQARTFFWEKNLEGQIFFWTKFQLSKLFNIGEFLSTAHHYVKEKLLNKICIFTFTLLKYSTGHKLCKWYCVIIMLKKKEIRKIEQYMLAKSTVQIQNVWNHNQLLYTMFGTLQIFSWLLFWFWRPISLYCIHQSIHICL